jgi:hypothetical protein
MNFKKIIEKYGVVILVVAAILVIRFVPDKNNHDIDLEKFKGIADLSQSINEQVQENIDYISGKDDDVDSDIMDEATKKLASDINNIKPENDQEKDLLTIMKAQKNFVEKDVKAQDILYTTQSSVPMDQVLLPQNIHTLANIEKSLKFVKIMQDSVTSYMQSYIKNYNNYVTELEASLIDKNLAKTVRNKTKKGFDLTTNANNRAQEGYKIVEELLIFCKKLVLSGSIEFDGENILFETDEQVATYNSYVDKIDKNIEEHDIALQAMRDHAKQNAETAAKTFK